MNTRIHRVRHLFYAARSIGYLHLVFLSTDLVNATPFGLRLSVLVDGLHDLLSNGFIVPGALARTPGVMRVRCWHRREAIGTTLAIYPRHPCRPR